MKSVPSDISPWHNSSKLSAESPLILQSHSLTLRPFYDPPCYSQGILIIGKEGSRTARRASVFLMVMTPWDRYTKCLWAQNWNLVKILLLLIFIYCQTPNKTNLIRQSTCASFRCSWSSASEGCSNYMFILDLTPCFHGLGKDNCKTRQVTSKFLDLVHLTLEVWQHFYEICIMRS